MKILCFYSSFLLFFLQSSQGTAECPNHANPVSAVTDNLHPHVSRAEDAIVYNAFTRNACDRPAGSNPGTPLDPEPLSCGTDREWPALKDYINTCLRRPNDQSEVMVKTVQYAAKRSALQLLYQRELQLIARIPKPWSTNLWNKFKSKWTGRLNELDRDPSHSNFVRISLEHGMDPLEKGVFSLDRTIEILSDEKNKKMDQEGFPKKRRDAYAFLTETLRYCALEEAGISFGRDPQQDMFLMRTRENKRLTNQIYQSAEFKAAERGDIVGAQGLLSDPKFLPLQRDPYIALQLNNAIKDKHSFLLKSMTEQIRNSLASSLDDRKVENRFTEMYHEVVNDYPELSDRGFYIQFIKEALPATSKERAPLDLCWDFSRQVYGNPKNFGIWSTSDKDPFAQVAAGIPWQRMAKLGNMIEEKLTEEMGAIDREVNQALTDPESLITDTGVMSAAIAALPENRFERRVFQAAHCDRANRQHNWDLAKMGGMIALSIVATRSPLGAMEAVAVASTNGARALYMMQAIGSTVLWVDMARQPFQAYQAYQRTYDQMISGKASFADLEESRTKLLTLGAF